ncbi:MAG: pheromone shutdown-related protein TraB [Colwellia polaris]|jgi:pheromone shutdown-related protein TraB
MKEKIQLDDREITLVGTAHVSEDSIDEVIEAIDKEQPDKVFVELDENRLHSLQEKSGWKDTDLLEVIREGKINLLSFNLLLSIYQKKIGAEHGIKPGTELLKAVEHSEENGIPYELVDRDINETIDDLRKNLSLWKKSALIASFMAFGEDEEETDIEELKQADMIEALVEEMGEDFPEIKEVLLDKRNSYMAQKILESGFENGLVVVGAAHVQGLKEELQNNTQHNYTVEKTFPWGKAAMYGIPLLVLGLFTYGFMQGGVDQLIQLGVPWIVLNSSLSLLGALIARSHLSTGLISAAAAPLTSVNPTVGAGMVAAYAEAYFHPPTVKDMEEIVDITEYRQLWNNQAGVVVLTFIFVTIGSFIATVLGAGVITYLVAFI